MAASRKKTVKKPRPTGRPTDYTPELLEAAELYVSGKWIEEDDLVPTVAGLAIFIGVSRDTCYAWESAGDKPEFSDILARVREIQERRLVNGGLSNQFNPAITKMMLSKHGYSDRQDIAHTSPDGSMSPPTRIVIEAASADSKDTST